MWRRGDSVYTDVSEERIATIFRVEESLQPPTHAGSSLTDFFLLFFYPEDGGDTFLQNVGLYNIYTAPHLRRRHSWNNINLHSRWTRVQSLRETTT
jgi:hypothetical protein